MSRLSDLFRRIGRASQRSRASGWDAADDGPGPGSWLSIGGASIGLGGDDPDRDHDGIADRDDGEPSDSGDGDSGGDD